MKISMNEFNPFLEPLELGDKIFYCRPFDLRAETWAETTYNSFSEYIGKVTDGDPSAIYGGIYNLLKNKDFSFSYFVKQICLKPNDKAKEYLNDMAVYLVGSLQASQPLIKNPKRAKEIKEILASGIEASPDENYAAIFDKIASRYGYSIETFYSMTSRQVHSCFKAIGDADYKDLELNAALAGRQLKEKMKYHDISVEEEEENHSDALASIERHKARFKKDNK